MIKMMMLMHGNEAWKSTLGRACLPVPFLSHSCPLRVPFMSPSCPLPVPFVSPSCPLHVPRTGPERERGCEPPYRRSESPTGLCLAEVVLHLPLDDVAGPRDVMFHGGIHVAGEQGGARGRQRHLLGGCDLWGWFCGQQGDNEATTRRKRGRLQQEGSLR